MHSTTGALAAEMLMGRKLRSALDLLKSDLHLRVENEQERQKVAHDKHSVARSFQVGEAVYVRNFRPGPMWEPAHIVEAAGTLFQSEAVRQRCCVASTSRSVTEAPCDRP